MQAHFAINKILQTFFVKKFSRIFPGKCDFSRDRAQKLDDVCKVILVSGVIFTGVRLKEVISRRQLEGHTSGRPGSECDSLSSAANLFSKLGQSRPLCLFLFFSNTILQKKLKATAGFKLESTE